MPIAPATVIGAPTRRPFPDSLIDHARAFGSLVEHDDDRFIAGVAFDALACGEAETYPICGAVREIQSVDIPDNSTAGTFTLTYTPSAGPAETTAGIPFDATAAQVAAALNALPSIALGGGVTATGGPLPTAAVLVTFAGTGLSGNQTQMTGDGTGLTPSGAVTVATTQGGTNSATKSTGANHPGLRSFMPYPLYARDSCSTIGWRSADYERRARELLMIGESEAIEREIWTGTRQPTNPRFNNGATTVGTAQGRALGLALLVQAIADGNGGIGMIHARPKLVELWHASGGLYRDALSGLLFTATGIPVVAGAGYPGTGPADQATSATSEWAFATDIVSVHLGPVFVTPDSGEWAQATNRSTNVVEWRAERGVVAVWNGCVLAAVEVNPANS